MSVAEGVLRRERLVVGAALVALCLLSWSYLLRGAGMGMDAWAMTHLALFPHRAADAMAAMAAPEISSITVVAMWWIMMIGMMTPSAAPLVLLYARVMRHASTHASRPTYASTAALAAGYLLVWLGFSVVATAMHYLLQAAGLMSPGMLWSRSAVLSAAILAAAGLYQLTPLKHACLRHCRGPVEFLARHRRTGRSGALLMGMQHGIWCIGCCWALMGLLFVGGVMNLVWVALLALLVLAEKLTPHGMIVGRVTGLVLIAWSLATLLA